MPARKDFLAYIKKFVDNKMMADDWYLWQGTDGTAKMVASEVGIYATGAWGVYTTPGLHPKFPNLKFISALTGPGGDGRWGFMSSPGVSEQFSAALLKDEAKLKRALHIIDEFANPFSGPYKATYFRNYKMDPAWPEGVCFVKEIQETGPFVRVVAWTKDTMAAASADIKKTCPWFADDKLYRGIPEWRPVGISVWSKWGSYVYGPGKLEDTGNADTGIYMSNTWYPWWAQLKGQKYYLPISIRGDAGIQADVMKQVYANELKFVLGQRPLTEWDAYVKDILTKYKATDLLKTTVTALQDQGLPVTGIDPRIPV